MIFGSGIQMVTGLPGAAGTTVTWANDLAGSTSSSQIVVSVTGSAGVLAIATTAATLRWAAAASSPTLTQSDLTTNSGTGQTLSVFAQNATGTTSNGAILQLLAGTGTATNGGVRLGYRGQTFATTGEIRTAQAATWKTRNTLNDTNLNVITAGDAFTFGDSNVSGMTWAVSTPSSFAWTVGGSQVLSVADDSHPHITLGRSAGGTGTIEFVTDGGESRIYGASNSGGSVGDMVIQTGTDISGDGGGLSLRAGGTEAFRVSRTSGVLEVRLNAPQVSSATLGGASALPALPATYLRIVAANGTTYRIPGYTDA